MAAPYAVARFTTKHPLRAERRGVINQRLRRTSTAPHRAIHEAAHRLVVLRPAVLLWNARRCSTSFFRRDAAPARTARLHTALTSSAERSAEPPQYVN
jgi:hypothetical protein